MGRRRLTQSEFIRRANIAHNNKYDYSMVHYTVLREKVQVICPTHGSFFVEPGNHIHHWDKKYSPNKKPCGCGLCGKEFTKTRNGAGRLSQDEVISRFNQIHSNQYDYTKSVYTGRLNKITIICKIHGEFQQKVEHHLAGCGCPACKNSHGQSLIKAWLDTHQQIYHTEHIFINCVNPKTGYKLKFDFYLPHQNIVIEYDGEQHFKPVKFHQKMDDKLTHDMFEKTKQLDMVKNQYCNDNKINIIRIPYTCKNNIADILTHALIIEE